MTKRERLESVFAGHKPDRTPILGGWIACPEHICALAGVSLDQYWQDPHEASIRAYKALGSDGLISLYVPPIREDYRCVDASSYSHADTNRTLEETLALIDDLPSPQQIESDFDFEAAYESFAQDLRQWQERCGEMVWMPAQWGAGAQASWYGWLGYEQFFWVVGLHEDRARKLMEVGGAHGLNRCRLVAHAVEDGIFPHAVLLGEDICTQRGPMISPVFLEKHYAPQLRRGLEPLLEAGCRPVWHCDGDVRPLVDMLLDCGVQGFQGFQPECGMTIDYVASKRTREGGKLVIFGPIAVTTELPVCSPEEIRARVRRAIEVCRDNADLVMFTGNTINPDVPLANIIAMHEEVREYEL